MPKINPISRKKLISKLKALGFEKCIDMKKNEVRYAFLIWQIIPLKLSDTDLHRFARIGWLVLIDPCNLCLSVSRLTMLKS